jgi:hypothetical protein
MEMMEMLMFLIALPCLGSCFIITLIFGLFKAGRKADEAEERILKIISSAQLSKTVAPGDTASARARHAAPAV